MEDILEKIIAHKKIEVAAAKSKLSEAELFSLIEKNQDTPRGFMKAMQAQNAKSTAAVIAEIKRASPSLGRIRDDFSSADFAKAYQNQGATCLSVLTDSVFFQGSIAYMQEARSACDLPVLRKDFMIDPYQIIESRAYGADCILLIVCVLTDDELLNFTNLAQDLGLDILIETHDADELERALKLPVTAIGVNNRNLRDFSISMERSIELNKMLPSHYFLISESGFHHHADIIKMQKHGINSFLIGGSLMQEKDPGAALGKIIYGEGETHD